MKQRFLALSVVFVVTISLATPCAQAAPKKKPKPPEIHQTVISSIAPDAITIQEDKMTKSFKVTPFTEVTLRGQKAAITDLQPGMLVSVTQGSDALTAARIVATGDSPVHDEKPKSKYGK